MCHAGDDSAAAAKDKVNSPRYSAGGMRTSAARRPWHLPSLKSVQAWSTVGGNRRAQITHNSVVFDCRGTLEY